VRIDRAGFPFILIAAIPAALAWWLGAPVVALVLLLLPVAIGLFFRDPDRPAPPADPALVFSPADGTVMYAGPGKPGETPPGSWQHVTIFLSPLDVHINRSPVSGKVTRVTYREGTFLPAYKAGAHANEQSEVWVDHDGQTVVFRQVVGMVARRVVCRVEAGAVLKAGERFGLMKFGSRMDVFLPHTATLQVTVGQKVRAADTVIGRLAAHA
jgi:phosphatidylserine decarboxylase